MKHLDEYKIFENKIGNLFRDSKIKSICKKYNIRNYTINDDGSIDVCGGGVELTNKKLTKLPLKFNRVSGNFLCNYNNLTSLEGCPKYVGGEFDCSNNKLTSLEGGPKVVNGYYFDCRYNKLTSLEGCSEHISGDFNCYGNPVFSVVQYFKKTDNLIELFNYYDIIQDMNVIYDRLKFFYDGVDVKVTDKMLREIEGKGYKIIR